MARIQEEVIVITVSKLHKNADLGTSPDGDITTDEQLDAIASVVEELLGNGVVVEINKA